MTRSPATKSLAAAFAAALLAIGGSPAAAQTTAPLQAAPRLPASGWVPPDAALSIELNRPVDPAEGRLAVLVGTNDWSALTEIVAGGIELRPGPVLLPNGEHELAVFLVSPANEWTELGRFPLRVLTPGGYQVREAAPAVDISNKGQLLFDTTPDQPDTPRDTYQDLAITAGVRTRTVKGGWTTETQFNIAGASFAEERLRFATEGRDAPHVDLANYLVAVGNHRTRFSLGHVTLATQRHLGTDLAARGAQGWFRLAPAVDLMVGATNGTSIVGWSNPFGLSDADHQLRAAALGFDLRPSRPGGVRVVATYLDGAVLPLNGYTENLVNDAERSRGYGLQFSAAQPADRLRIDAGFARTRFDNPSDALLSRGFTPVDVRTTTRNARYLDLAFDVLRGVRLGTSPHQATLTAGYRHERVDPLYRTVATPLRADLLQHVAEATALVGPVATQLSYTWLHDNLDDIASILTTRTRVLGGRVAVPLSAFRPSLGARAQWVPTVTYQIDRTHQYGDGLPPNSDFDSASQVPDQMNTTHTAGLDWQGPIWSAGYRFNRSQQDNRQIGRQLADLDNLNHGVTFSVTPHARLDAALDVAFEGAENKEIDRTDLTRRFSVLGNWRPLVRTAVMGTLTSTRIRDEARTTERNVTDFSMQLSQTLALGRWKRTAPGATLFLRCGRQTLFVIDPVGGANDDRTFWTLNAGLTFKVF